MRVVFISGSSRGIGLGIARAFIMENDVVVLNGREDVAQLKWAVKTLREEFPQKAERITGMLGDLSDYKTCEKIFMQIEEEFGGVDVLVNNAGVAHFGLFTDMNPFEMQNILNANLSTALYASHQAVPFMVRKKAGCIINITSIWGIVGASCEVVYAVAKAGVIGLTKSLAKELAPSGIRVNAIACGAFETRMNARLSDEEKNAFTEEIPLGRFGLSHEAGDLAVFLASQKAGYLTGQVIPLDGGVV
ncbi:MAG: SDR family oxidoreductase [Defluviitaleaceae bacterium]|nr:SDR family oxidoreductase [Defluviitaleaceae bacterium]